MWRYSIRLNCLPVCHWVCLCVCMYVCIHVHFPLYLHPPPPPPTPPTPPISPLPPPPIPRLQPSPISAFSRACAIMPPSVQSVKLMTKQCSWVCFFFFFVSPTVAPLLGTRGQVKERLKQKGGCNKLRWAPLLRGFQTSRDRPSLWSTAFLASWLASSVEYGFPGFVIGLFFWVRLSWPRDRPNLLSLVFLASW